MLEICFNSGEEYAKESVMERKKGDSGLNPKN